MTPETKRKMLIGSVAATIVLVAAAAVVVVIRSRNDVVNGPEAQTPGPSGGSTTNESQGNPYVGVRDEPLKIGTKRELTADEKEGRSYPADWVVMMEVKPDGTQTLTVLSGPKPDADDDGLSDEDETRLKTDPNKVDTDGDGAGDNTETLEKTDPLRPDTDNDGMNDGDELQNKRDPLDPTK